ncbi:Alpha-glucosidase [Bertholletia excelsa]
MATLRITRKHHKHFNNPFPSAPRSLPLLLGALTFNPQTLPSFQIFSIGPDFELIWQPKNGGSLSISHKSQPSISIWSTIPGQAFVSAALAETEVEESRGSFAIRDAEVHLVCNQQTIDDIRVIKQFDNNIEPKDHGFSSGFVGLDHNTELKDAEFPALIITGRVFSVKRKKKKIQTYEISQFVPTTPPCSASYRVLFYQKSSNQVGFHVKLAKPSFEFHQRTSKSYGIHNGFPRKLGRFRRPLLGWCRHFAKRRAYVTVASTNEENVAMRPVENKDFNRVVLTYSSERSEKFYGFGEQFSHMNFKGKRVPILVQEQGIGRGDQPITFAANLVSYRAAGDWSTTYAPSPFYISSKMRSLYLEGYSYSVFDLKRHDRVQIQMHGDSIQGKILFGNTPLEFIEHFTRDIGRPPKLPDWIISGAVIGMQGGTDFVRHVWDKLRTYDVPVSAFWLQDWVGQRKTVIGSQLWWNWEVDMTRYPGWQQLIRDLSACHIKVMTYCNPCLAPMDERPNKRRDLFEEAKKLDILVKDKDGKPYMVPNTAFDVGMLDLTHPHTSSWFKKIPKEMVNDGVRGWMADFGEGLPVDASLYSSEDPFSAHNRYPELWAKINREFVDEWKSTREGREREDPEESLVFFMRAGFRNSPKWGLLFWEGDQMVSWQANDGIKSAVVGLLSSGISGYAFNHSDTGGYCAVSFPFCKYQRTEELLLRWMELSAFTTVFRTHEGNKPSINSQFYSNHRTLSHFARFAKVYKAWKFYRTQLVKEASQKGFPVCRHLFLHYPDDENVHNLSYEQFLVGEEILVAPVLDKGKKNVKVYFPMGKRCSWKHIWTGNLYTEHGYEAQVEASIGYPAIFVKADRSLEKPS